MKRKGNDMVSKPDPYKTDADNPEWTETDHAHVRPSREVFAGLAMEMPRPRGRPRGSNKTRVSILLDNDLIAALKAQGEKGWQTRANKMLRKALLEG